MSKRIPTPQHQALIEFGLFQCENGREFARPSNQTPENLKPANLLLRRGFVMRAEFTDRSYGYRVTGSGMDYLLEHEPDTFFIEEEGETT